MNPNGWWAHSVGRVSKIHLQFNGSAAFLTEHYCQCGDNFTFADGSTCLSQLVSSVKTFLTVFRSVDRILELYLQNQLRVRKIIFPCCSLNGNISAPWFLMKFDWNKLIKLLQIWLKFLDHLMLVTRTGFDWRNKAWVRVFIKVWFTRLRSRSFQFTLRDLCKIQLGVKDAGNLL